MAQHFSISMMIQYTFLCSFHDVLFLPLDQLFHRKVRNNPCKNCLSMQSCNVRKNPCKGYSKLWVMHAIKVYIDNSFLFKVFSLSKHSVSILFLQLWWFMRLTAHHHRMWNHKGFVISLKIETSISTGRKICYEMLKKLIDSSSSKNGQK